MESSVNSTGRALQILCIVLSILTLSHYWHFLSIYLLNAPDSDDYIDIFWFFEIFLDANSPSEKLYALFLPIHEHITVVSHIIYTLHYQIFDEINFSHYILIGQLIMLGICLCLAAHYKKFLSWPISITIAILFYFNLSFWHSSFWAMTAISNQVVILLALLSIFVLSRKPDKIYFPLFLAVSSCFSQANGLGALLALMLLLGLDNLRNKKNILGPRVLVVGLLFIAILAFHIIHQNPFTSHHHLDHQAYTTEPESIALYQRDISGTDKLEISATAAIHSFFAITGASALQFEQTTLASVLGLVILLFWVYLLWKKMPIDNFTLGAVTFTLISIALIAAGRGPAGVDFAAMNSRYRMYSLLLFALTAYQLIRISPRQQTTTCTVICLALLLQLAGRSHEKDMVANNKMLTSSYYNWLLDGGFGRSTMPVYPPNQGKRLQIATDAGRYTAFSAIPDRHFPTDIKQGESVQKSCDSAKLSSKAELITAYSKRPRALASELVLDIPWDQPDEKALLSVLLCPQQRPEDAMQLVLESKHHLNSDNNKPWPILVSKQQLPRGKYSAYYQWGDEILVQPNNLVALGEIFIK